MINEIKISSSVNENTFAHYRDAFCFTYLFSLFFPSTMAFSTMLYLL